MSLLNRFINYIQKENLFQKKDTILLAVSGGVDSVVLCELCKQAGFHFKIAHCNFQLRGEESERDQQFVQSLGERYETEVFIKKFDTEKYAAENKLSIQVAARELRYAWFNELIQPSTYNLELSTGPDPGTSYIVHRTSYIATAHHANDNIETVLINFFKGTGSKGLRGILPKQGKIMRPLLFAKREEIVAFAKENNVSFVEDSSNASDKYTRNYFRNQLIPSIQKVFPQVEENLLNNIERFKDTEILYQQALNLHKKKLLEYKGNEIHIPVLKLLNTEPLKTIIYEIIKEYRFTSHQAEEVLQLLKSDSGKYISSDTHKIIKNRKWLIIAPHNTREASLIIISEEDTTIEFEGGRLTLDKYNKDSRQLSTDNNIATLDADTVRFPLLLRKWKQGDYFYPLGMQNLPASKVHRTPMDNSPGPGRRGKKKLSRFFIDQKMSLTEKEQVWIIESDKRIAWILGKRIDDRFKITGRTHTILSIHFSAL